jgi:Lectin C-type domain
MGRNPIPLVCMVVTIASMTTECSAQVLAGPMTNPSNNFEYYLLAANTWTNSQAEAVSMGGNLATVTDASVNAWILNTFSPLVDSSLWIGFYDPDIGDTPGAQHEADFIWASGAPITYTNWAPGEPNDGAGGFGGEYYTVMYPSLPGTNGPAGTWNDENNSASGTIAFGVVEVVPEPSCVEVLALLSLIPRRHPARLISHARAIKVTRAQR